MRSVAPGCREPRVKLLSPVGTHTVGQQTEPRSDVTCISLNALKRELCAEACVGTKSEQVGLVIPGMIRSPIPSFLRGVSSSFTPHTQIYLLCVTDTEKTLLDKGARTKQSDGVALGNAAEKARKLCGRR